MPSLKRSCSGVLSPAESGVSRCVTECAKAAPCAQYPIGYRGPESQQPGHRWFPITLNTVERCKRLDAIAEKNARRRANHPGASTVSRASGNSPG